MIEEISRGTIQANPGTSSMVSDASDTEWHNFLNQIDTVEEVIRKEIEQEGKDNLILADEQRMERRQHWQEQWEKFLANAKLACRKIPHEAESNHSLLIQEINQNENIITNTFVLDASDRLGLLLADQETGTEVFSQQPHSKLQNCGVLPQTHNQTSCSLAAKNLTPDYNKQSNIPYSEYMKDGSIVYNGITFQYGDGFLSLGDVSNPANVLTIPLASGGSLLVNRDCIGQLGKAMGMFSAEDFGNILRAIAEDRKVQSMKYEMEENENSTVNHLVEHTENISNSEKTPD